MTLPNASEVKHRVERLREGAREPLRQLVYNFIDEIVAPAIEQAAGKGLMSTKIDKSSFPIEYGGVYHFHDFVEELNGIFKNYGYKFQNEGSFFKLSWS